MELISCLLITRERPQLVIRAIADFARQDYPAKELIIVCDGKEHRDSINAAVSSLATHARVTAYERDRYSLGELRNRAIRIAEGNVLCQWDDDDYHHPSRLRQQYECMRSNGFLACFLSEHLQLMAASGTVYWCDWLRPRERPQWPAGLPGTIMCDRRLSISYPRAGILSERGEDAVVMSQLRRSCSIGYVAGTVPLYIYVTHGANTWSESHHRQIPQITGLSSSDLLSRRERCAYALREHGLHGPIDVVDYAGQAVFRWLDDELRDA